MENKERVYFTGIIAMVIFMAIVIWFINSGRTDVHNIRIGADHIGAELEQAGRTQQEEAGAIDRSAEAVDRSQERIEESQNRNSEIQRIEQSDTEIIGESKSILKRVRERRGKENQN